jgi:2-iminobutanoate/2-iminopropanoate deaminase
MPKQQIITDKLYRVLGPYSHAVRAGDLIFLHGTVGFDAQGNLPGTVRGQTDMVGQCHQTIDNMATALELLGGSLADVVKVRAFLPHHCRPGRAGQLSYDETFDSVYRQRLQPPYPARAALQHGLFLADLLVEIEAIAVLNQAKQLIASDALPPLRRPYAQGGLRLGNLLFLRGFTSQNAHGDVVGPGDMRAQTEQTFANMAVVLAAVDGSLADLVQTQVTLTDWHFMPGYNEVYTRHVHEPFPTRTTVQGGLGREGLLIEIESIAALGGARLSIDAVTPQPGRSILQRRDDVIYAAHLPPAAASYTHGVRLGDLMFVAGQLSLDAHGHLLGPGDIRMQTRQVLDHIRTILQLADLSLDDVVKTTVMLTDWRYYEAYNDVYRTYFSPPYPARSTIESGLAHQGALIEIDAIAVAGARHNAVAVTTPEMT